MAELIEIEIFPKAQSDAVKRMKAMLGDVMILPNMGPINEMKKSLQVLAPKMAPAAVKNFETIIQNATQNAMNAALQAQRSNMAMSPVTRSFSAGQAMVGGAGAAVGRAGGAVLNNLPGIGGISKLAGVASAAAGGLTSLLGPVGVLLGAITGIVGAINPAIVRQLMVAFEEIWGVIGQALTPVVEAIIPIIQAFGDIVAGLMPLLKPVITIFQILAKIVLAVVNAFKWVLGLIGLGDKTSRGASQQGVGFASISELGKSFNVAGFAQGSIEREQLAKLAGIELTAKEIQADMKRRGEDSPPRNPYNG